jgi:hypothetical protein
MIARLLEELKKFLPKAAVPFDPAQFNDSIALKTPWNPLKGGGTNIRTHAMKLDREGRCEFRVAPGYIAFCGLFLVIGLGILIAILCTLNPREPKDYFPIPIGAVFATVGGCLLYFGGRPVVFDKQSGLAWRGWHEPRQDFEHGRERSGSLCRLDDIHALQIVSELVRSKNNSYRSYELNLVLVDASRLNVVDHGDVARIRKDAAELGLYLEVPVWDATVVDERRS